jgi:hypothetical protein
MKTRQNLKVLIQVLENANEAWKFDGCEAIFSIAPYILQKLKEANAKLNKNQLKVVLESISYLVLNYGHQK